MDPWVERSAGGRIRQNGEITAPCEPIRHVFASIFDGADLEPFAVSRMRLSAYGARETDNHEWAVEKGPDVASSTPFTLRGYQRESVQRVVLASGRNPKKTESLPRRLLQNCRDCLLDNFILQAQNAQEAVSGHPPRNVGSSGRTRSVPAPCTIVKPFSFFFRGPLRRSATPTIDARCGSRSASGNLLQRSIIVIQQRRERQLLLCRRRSAHGGGPFDTVSRLSVRAVGSPPFPCGPSLRASVEGKPPLFDPGFCYYPVEFHPRACSSFGCCS